VIQKEERFEYENLSHFQILLEGMGSYFEVLSKYSKIGGKESATIMDIPSYFAESDAKKKMKKYAEVIFRSVIQLMDRLYLARNMSRNLLLDSFGLSFSFIFLVFLISTMHL
jgi:hypothetical protein